MPKLTAVIIDDVELSVKCLKQTVEDFIDNLEVVGEAYSVVSGAKLVKNIRPDIILLDIEMPDGTGFDLLDLLPEDVQSRVIFTTGSDEYAIRAFRYAAVDYLLKPIDPDDLKVAVNRAISEAPKASEIKFVLSEQDENGIPNRITLHTSEEVRIVRIADIVRCQSDNNYCQIFIQPDEKLLQSKPLKHFAELLEPAGFIRTHQSHLVNINFIRSYIKRDGGYLMLADGSQVPVSIRNRPDLLEKLDKLFGHAG